MGVLIHVLCDAANNLGVIAAALVIWLAKYDGRYYADPGVSMGIALMIMLSSIPLGKRYLPHETVEYATESLFFTSVRRAGLILLESAPNGLDLSDVQHDLEKVSSAGSCELKASSPRD